MNEPSWRRILCWGALIMFFMLPLTIFCVHLAAVEFNWQFDNRIEEFNGIMPVYQTISALVFGLAGLNSFDRFFNHRANSKNQKPGTQEQNYGQSTHDSPG